MTKSTTPTYILEFDSEFTFDAVIFWTVALKQGKTLLTIDDPQVDTENKTLTITLTQEQTLSFQVGEANIQVKGKFADGTVFASEIEKVPVNTVLDERIIE